jgi:mono/diheme cytochrome c family protein
MDFDGAGRLSFALSATFDAGLTGCAARQYFVPNGCNACHGSPGNLRAPMVNYLDTDHWFDRLADDFAEVTDPLLFDAHTNETNSPDFAGAFDVIRQFNEEALQQNNLVHPDSFETAAARTWLGLHATSDAHALPVARGFSTSPGGIWQAAEADGLGLLNRFCFRCHGSVRFSIFDRPSVIGRSANMRQRIKPSAVQARTPGFKMPPDRTLTPEQITALDNFLKNLSEAP